MKVQGSPSPGNSLAGLLYVAPFLILYCGLLLVPFVMGLDLSLYNADLFGARQWVGFENYARLINDPIFLQSIWTTFKLALLIVPSLTCITLCLALALNKATRSAAIFRGIFFSSSVLSVTIVTLIWRFVLTPDAGLIAKILTAIGLAPIPFLSHPDLTVPAIALTTVWWGLGLPMMLFVAGLQQIPTSLYEAAALDGAGRWRTFWSITVPSLRRTLILVVMLQTSAQLQLFGQAQLLTSGGPGGASRTMVLYISEVAFGRWELGYAIAAAELLFLMVVVLTLLQYWAASRNEIKS
jgi:multiple sugar transport system permease protein